MEESIYISKGGMQLNHSTLMPSSVINHSPDPPIHDNAQSQNREHSPSTKITSTSKYYRIRQLAEQEAKRHIDKLNSLMDMRLNKEKKVLDNLKESSNEREYKFNQI